MNAFVLLIASLAAAEAPAAPPLPAAPEIALLTMGPGRQVWERYGHAAIAVRQPTDTEAWCYNYGTFNFTDPAGLAWGILRSKPVFWVSAQPCGRFIESYMRFGRAVYRQVIPLEPAAAQALADALEKNARPENKHYVYHHFWDNCSTRPRDLVNKALGGKLEIAGEKPLDVTFRRIGMPGLADNSYLMLALDTFLGRGGDHAPTLFEAAAVPDYLRRLVQERAGVAPEVIYVGKFAPLESAEVPPWWQRWGMVAGLIVTPALIAWLLGQAVRFGAALALLVPTLIGLALWFLAGASTLPELRFNELLLVFFPPDLAVVFLSEHRRKLYARARLGMLSGVLILKLVGVLSQPLFGPVLVVALPLLTIAFPIRRRNREALQWT